MWPFNLSVRLPIVDLVGRYPTNYLIGREPIFDRIAPLAWVPCDPHASCGISRSFPLLSPYQRQVAHALLTRPPLTLSHAFRRINPTKSVRLECVMHAASVHPEPGSNSLKNCISKSKSSLDLISFLRAFALALYYLLELLLNSKEFSESTSLLTFPLSST